jgi:hypothetical protein
MIILIAVITSAIFAGASAKAQFMLPVASDDIIFELDFDSDGTTADISAGRPKLLAKVGELKFAEGLRGKALVCGEGGAKLMYRKNGNLDFSSPGTITFWVKPIEWGKAAEFSRVFFFGMEYSKGFLGIQIASGPKGVSPLERNLNFTLLYFKSIADTTLSIQGFGRGTEKRWHMIALEWDNHTIFLSVDGKPLSRKALQGTLSQKLFPGRHFSLGSNYHAKYLMDQFRIYNRRLSNEELKRIYETLYTKR